eukprot:7740953-Pyramimonas_sp.AAC.1
MSPPLSPLCSPPLPGGWGEPGGAESAGGVDASAGPPRGEHYVLPPGDCQRRLHRQRGLFPGSG